MTADEQTVQALLKAGPCVHCAIGPEQVVYDDPDDDPMEFDEEMEEIKWSTFPYVSFSRCRICGHRWAYQQ